MIEVEGMATMANAIRGAISRKEKMGVAEVMVTDLAADNHELVKLTNVVNLHLSRSLSIVVEPKQGRQGAYTVRSKDGTNMVPVEGEVHLVELWQRVKWWRRIGWLMPRIELIQHDRPYQLMVLHSGKSLHSVHTVDEVVVPPRRRWGGFYVQAILIRSRNAADRERLRKDAQEHGVKDEGGLLANPYWTWRDFLAFLLAILTFGVSARSSATTRGND